MRMARRVMMVFCAAATLLGAATASGQNYPNKPIRLITADPGGSSDFVARIIGQGLTALLAQQVVVENRGNASGIIASQMLAKAAPDGYTILVYGSGVWILPLIQKVPYDPTKDFAPVSLATISPNVLVIHPSLPVKSVQELIAYAKSKPGELNFGIGGIGNSPHLSSELFKSMAKIDIVRVNYRGIAAAVNANIGGQTQITFANAAPVTPHVKTGRLRALGITSAQPSALVPGLAPIATLGLPGYESTSKAIVFAPARTPPALIKLLSQSIAKVLSQPEFKERLFNSGVEPVGSTPEELARAMKDEMTSMGKVIKEANIQGE